MKTKSFYQSIQNRDAMKEIRIGSLFSGIGGFELGVERAIPNSRTIWQVEEDKFCQSILKKHWPESKIYDDVRKINKNNVEPIDILLGGFPCQDISSAGKQKGIYDGNRSGLWWEMWRIIGELSEGPKKPIVIMENVANIIHMGGLDVLGSLAQIGYDAEWTIISAKQFGAPHLRNRWFCVAYPNEVRLQKKGTKFQATRSIQYRELDTSLSTHPNKFRTQIQTKREHTTIQLSRSKSKEGKFWSKRSPKPVLCGMDDGVSNRVARLKALGNAIVPQCSEYIGRLVYESFYQSTQK